MDNQKVAKADELFFVVDENDQPLAPLPRKLVHGHGVWHRVAHIWLVNGQGEILCQQRSFEKENNPGYWEGFFGGHMGPNEEYLTAARRELEEEIGIQIELPAFQFFKIYKFFDSKGYNNEFQAIYVVGWDGQLEKLRFDDGEVVQVAWKTLDEIRLKLKAPEKNKWSFCGYELDVLDFIESRRGV